METHEKVAIKIHNIASLEMLSSFNSEVEALKKVQNSSPYVGSYMESGSATYYPRSNNKARQIDVRYVVNELLPNGTLLDYI